MPYKDKEQQKVHDRQYYQENKEKRKIYAREYYQKNKGKVLVHKKQYYSKTKKQIIAYARLYRQKRRKKALKLFGNCCYFCGQKNYKHRLEFHNKNGNLHPDDPNNLILKNPEEWVLLCQACHRGIHFCKKHLGIVWDKLITMVKLP